jgi:superfamily II DNA or RNA helicase
MELRDYQLQAIQSARTETKRGIKRTVIYAPTGAGKTVIAEAVIRSALARGKRVAFIANRVDLIKQTSRRLSKILHGIIQGDSTRNINENFLICSIQTVAKRGLPFVDLIVIDEAHAVPGSKDYRKLLADYNNVPVLGLTATPFSRGMGAYDRAIGGAIFESMVVASTIRELIDEGYLVDCDIFAPTEPDLSNVKLHKNTFGEIDYSEKDLAKAVNKPELVGDIVNHWLRLANKKPTVCFATNIAHSQQIVARFNAAGIKAEHIDCYTDPEERAAIINRVVSGVTKVISNVGILCEGWDFPACSVMILARPTRSLIRWVQMAGRILRPYEGKERGLILDHSGSAAYLGYPTDDLPLKLCDGNVGKSKSKLNLNEECKATKCNECSFIKPPKTWKCPACGHEPVKKYNVEQVEGELKLVKRTKFNPPNKQSTYSQLLAIAKTRSYSDGWVSHKYREIYGVWPRSLRHIASEPTEAMLSWVMASNIRHAKSKEMRHAA